MKDIAQICKYFINEEIITNIESNFKRFIDAKPTDKDEIDAVISILYMVGVLKVNRLNTEDLRRTDRSGYEIVRHTMSFQRFRIYQDVSDLMKMLLKFFDHRIPDVSESSSITVNNEFVTYH